MNYEKIQREQLLAKIHKEIEPLEDGFFYYFPDKAGGLSSHVLRLIADELDKKNESWERQIAEYFATHPQNEEEEMSDEWP
jgi:hypothetical protein